MRGTTFIGPHACRLVGPHQRAIVHKSALADMTLPQHDARTEAFEKTCGNVEASGGMDARIT